MQRNFVESMAGYSLVCYLLQVSYSQSPSLRTETAFWNGSDGCYWIKFQYLYAKLEHLCASLDLKTCWNLVPHFFCWCFISVFFRGLCTAGLLTTCWFTNYTLFFYWITTLIVKVHLLMSLQHICVLFVCDSLYRR